MAQGSNEPIEGLYSDERYYEEIKKDSTEETPRLLVEGKDDRVFFEKLIESLLNVGEYNERVKQNLRVLKENIDTASILDVSGGNRERIETMCIKINENLPSDLRLLFVGFEDREYRGFDIPNSFTDSLGKHHVNGVNVWSRGHSLENYFFDIELLTSVYQDYLRTVMLDRPYDLLRLFQDNFDKGFQIALCLYMISRSLEELEPNKKNTRMKGSIKVQHFKFNDNIVQFDFKEWSKDKETCGSFNAIRRSSNTPKISPERLENEWIHWEQTIAIKNIECHPYITHGHITERVLYNMFWKSILHQNPEIKLQTNENKRPIDYINQWLTLHQWKQPDSPLIVLNQLGIV